MNGFIFLYIIASIFMTIPMSVFIYEPRHLKKIEIIVCLLFPVSFIMSYICVMISYLVVYLGIVIAYLVNAITGRDKMLRRVLYTGEDTLSLTKDSEYPLLDIDKEFYKIVDDTGIEAWYNSADFKDVKEQRHG